MCGKRHLWRGGGKWEKAGGSCMCGERETDNWRKTVKQWFDKNGCTAVNSWSENRKQIKMTSPDTSDNPMMTFRRYFRMRVGVHIHGRTSRSVSFDLCPITQTPGTVSHHTLLAGTRQTLGLRIWVLATCLLCSHSHILSRRLSVADWKGQWNVTTEELKEPVSCNNQRPNTGLTSLYGVWCHLVSKPLTQRCPWHWGSVSRHLSKYQQQQKYHF